MASGRSRVKLMPAQAHSASQPVRARPFNSLAAARKRCPALVLIPYEFDKYRHVSEELYKVGEPGQSAASGTASIGAAVHSRPPHELMCTTKNPTPGFPHVCGQRPSGQLRRSPLGRFVAHREPRRLVHDSRTRKDDPRSYFRPHRLPSVHRCSAQHPPRQVRTVSKRSSTSCRVCSDPQSPVRGKGGPRAHDRLSTKKAKPNGQFYLPPDQADSFLLPVCDPSRRRSPTPYRYLTLSLSIRPIFADTVAGAAQLAVGDLPSVGWALRAQLNELGVQTVKDLRAFTCDGLQRHLGTKVGETVYNFARGIDDRPLAAIQPRKSVGAEVNWGIRFEHDDQVAKFLADLAAEVAKRLHDAGAYGRTITLKVRCSRVLPSTSGHGQLMPPCGPRNPRCRRPPGKEAAAQLDCAPQVPWLRPLRQL